MYVNINLNNINYFTGTTVFNNIMDTRLLFREYGIYGTISLSYVYGYNFNHCMECEKIDCYNCHDCKEEKLVLQTDARYIEDVVDVIESETGLARSIILYCMHLTDREMEEVE